jgi:putative aldouronate transport system substrate-binding protein
MSDDYEDVIRINSPKNLPQDFTQELIDQWTLRQKAYEAGLIYNDPFFFVPIESVTRYAGSLTSMFQEFATALVKADPDDFDAMYEEYVQRYLAAGFQEIMDERLAAYNAGLSTRLPDIAAGRAPYTPPPIAEELGINYRIFQ